MHGQTNLIKFAESSKFDNVCSKIWNILFDQFFKKNSLMKISESKFKIATLEKHKVLF